MSLEHNNFQMLPGSLKLKCQPEGIHGGWEDKYLRKYKIYIHGIYIYVEVDLGSFPGMAYLVGILDFGLLSM